MSAVLLLASLAAHASFDCGNATSAAERTICADPELGRADLSMAANYARALTGLSPSGRASLRDEQRRFVALTERECRPGGLAFISSGDSRPQTFGHCLLLAFQGRAKSLATAVPVAGGRRFLTLHRDRAKHVACDDCTNFPAIRTEQIKLMQLDAPGNASERAWNATVRRRIDEWRTQDAYAYAGDSGAGDVDIGVEIASASHDLLSATIGVSSYGAGAAHPNYSSETVGWSFRLGRPLTATDLFSDARSAALRRLVTLHYGAGG